MCHSNGLVSLIGYGFSMRIALLGSSQDDVNRQLQPGLYGEFLKLFKIKLDYTNWDAWRTEVVCGLRVNSCCIRLVLG